MLRIRKPKQPARPSTTCAATGDHHLPIVVRPSYAAYTEYLRCTKCGKEIIHDKDGYVEITELLRQPQAAEPIKPSLFQRVFK